jgi:poly-gamma-glutamate capsule biosynthesis protein CapA/YwtB (metallophosphatase superfamily)
MPFRTSSGRPFLVALSAVVVAATLGAQQPAPIRVCAGGDVILGNNFDPDWMRKESSLLEANYGMSTSPSALVDSLRPFFAGANIALVNVEGAIGDGAASRKCSTKSTNCFAFRQPPEAAGALASLADSNGVVVGNLANNHSHDAGADARTGAISILHEAGVLVTGADTEATPVPLANGDTVGVLGFHTASDVPDARDLAAVRRYVQRATERYRVVIVTMHLGAEGVGAQRTKNQIERFLNTNRGNPVAFAHTALDAGATLVIGHGPHVLRAAEWWGDRLVFYSLGNLLTFASVHLTEPTNRGAVVCATIAGPGNVSEATVHATWQSAPGVLRADSTRRAAALIDSLSALDFPKTGVTVDSAGAVGRRARSP